MVTNIVSETEHNFRCPIPARRDVFRHKSLISCGPGSTTARGVTSGKTKITDLEFAISIDQEVTGLEIAVQDVCRVNVFQTAQSLINERLKMGIG